MVIINKGHQSEIKLGTSNILYDQKYNDEFKFWFFENEIIGINPFNDPSVPQVCMSVDVYMVDISNTGPVIYGQGKMNDMEQIIPEYQGWHLHYSDRIPLTIKQIQLTPI